MKLKPMWYDKYGKTSKWRFTMKLLKYKGYIGDIQVSIEDDVLHGKLLYISALVTYEGQSVDDVKASFEEAIYDYLKTCEEKGYQPEVPC